jgi:hypothetical protein
MAIFSQRYDGPDDQGVRDDPNRARVAAGTTGPYSPAKTDPNSWRNVYVANFKKSSASRGLEIYDKVFSAKDAEESQNRIDSLNDQSNFSNSGDQALALKFVKDYSEGVNRGLVPQDEMINHQTIAPFQSQQPGQNVGPNASWNAGNKMDYPGKKSIQIS